MTNTYTQVTLDENTYPFAKEVNKRRNGQLAKFINQRAGRICTNKPKQTDLLNQAKLIQSELDELVENIELCNIEEIRDALGDILVTTYGFEGLMPLNIDRDYRIDVEANLSRIDETYNDATITQDKYLANGVKTEIHVVEIHGKTYYPVRTINETQIGLNGEKFTPNKFAKSHTFRQPTYPPLADIDGELIEIEFIKDIKPEEEKYVLQNVSSIHDGYHVSFWKKDGAGYTSNLDEAELFSLEDAEHIVNENFHGKFKIWNIKEMLKLAHPKIHEFQLKVEHIPHEPEQ